MSDPYFPSLKDIMTAEHTLNDILVPTPLMKNRNLSDKYEANIFLKREDLQMVRSYKIRGAYNKIKSLTPEEMEKGGLCQCRQSCPRRSLLLQQTRYPGKNLYARYYSQAKDQPGKNVRG